MLRAWRHRLLRDATRAREWTLAACDCRRRWRRASRTCWPAHACGALPCRESPLRRTNIRAPALTCAASALPPRSFVRGRVASVELDCALRRPAPAGAPPGAPATDVAGSVGGGAVLLADDGDGAAAAASLPYDYLVLALGADARAADVPGAAEHAIPFVTLQARPRAWRALRLS